MVKNQTPAKSFGKSPQNKGPQSMKKGGGSPNKPSPGGRTQQFNARGGGFTPKSQQKNFPSPKQGNFQKQTPKGPQQTPKGQQQTPGKGQKQQQSGKKTTPHPVKGKPQMESDEDDDDEFDSEEFDELDDEEMEDESGESLEDEESDDEKPANGSAKKLIQKPVQGKKGQLAQPPKKAANGKPGAEEESDEDDDDFDSEEDEEDEDEMESEEDEEDSDEDMEESPKKMLSFLKSDKKQATPAQKPGAAAHKAGATPVQKPGATPAQKPGQAADSQKGKVQAQQQSKPLKRPAPEEDEDDDDDEDEEDEDEDEEGDDDDEDDEDEDEEESEDDEDDVKAAKKGQQQQSQKTQPQKKMKTNEGAAVVTSAKGMPTKMDKKLLSETEERTRERDRRSLFIKDMPRNVTDEEIKALSPDIINVIRRGKALRWGWVVFANEQVCQKNYEKLKNAKMGNSSIFVDFCGDKSKAGGPKKELDAEQRVDALKLYVGNMPPKSTDADLKLLFPTASDIYFRSDRQFAFVSFETPEKARTAFEKSKDAKIKGALVQVSYARLRNPKVQHKKNDNVKKFADKQASGKVITRG